MTARLQPRTLSDGEREEMERQRAEAEVNRRREERIRRARDSWSLTSQRIGRRYSTSTLETFETPTPAHAAAKDAIASYVGSILGTERCGRGLLIHGPRGTGKDHLAVAAMRECAKAGFTTGFVDGQQLFADMRDSFDRSDGEHSVLREYIGPEILLISDPIPIEGKLSEFQQSVLWRIIDRRYRSMDMTWITANCKDGQELSERLGPQLCDRLTDDAVVVSTVGLKSFRKPCLVVK